MREQIVEYVVHTNEKFGYCSIRILKMVTYRFSIIG